MTLLARPLHTLAAGVCMMALAVCAHAQTPTTAPAAQESKADSKPWAVGLHLGSVHDINGFENNNVGAYVRYAGWTFGSFRNSVRKTSTYAAYTLEMATPKLPLAESVALTLGLTTGYPEKITGTDLSGLFVPTVAFKLVPDVRLRVAVIPAYQQFNRSTAMHFMVEKSF